ncbi:MAG: hypothetical protein J6Y37_00085 [Paludibacteraceae bacterium]|nr:hypothetical protein [Paludibacteraceae bacterium]
MTEQEIEDRIKECPFLDEGLCCRYNGTVFECNGTCAWVVDYPKLKEIYNRTQL